MIKWMNNTLREEAGEPEGGGGSALLGEAGGGGTPSDVGTADPYYQGLIGEGGKINKDSWDRLPDHLAGLKETISRHDTLDSILDSYANQRKALSGKGLTPPDENASEEVKAEYQSKVKQALGIPDSIDGYDFTPPEDLPEHLRWDDETAREVSEMMLNNNVSPQASQAIKEWYVNMKAGEEEKALSDFKGLEETALQEIAQSGQDPKVVGQTASQALALLGIDGEEASILTNSAVQAGLGSKFVQSMANLKALISEDKFASGQPGQGVVTGGNTDFKAQAEALDAKSSQAQASGDSALAQQYANDANNLWRLHSEQEKQRGANR